MSKNEGAFLAFNTQWFKRHQRLLLWLLNTPHVRTWFRHVLRIPSYDHPLETPISEIGPNYFSFGDKIIYKNKKRLLERTTNFKSIPQFSIRIYKAFAPLWWMMHFWDWLVADRLIPAVSFGFSTLTVNPATFSGGASPADGGAFRNSVNETFSTIRTSAGNGNQQSPSTAYIGLTGSATTNQYSLLRRGITGFDTSALTSSANISAAVLSLYGGFKSNGLGSDTFEIVAATPSTPSAIAAADYAQLGSTSFASMSYASFTASVYNDFTLNASGIAAISKTGNSIFGQMFGWDRSGTFSGTWSSGAQNEIDWNGGSNASNVPKLVITYSTSTAWTQTLTESATISNVLLKSSIRTELESFTITAALNKSLIRQLAESVPVADSVIKASIRLLSETATVTANLIKSPIRLLTESVTLSNVLTAFLVKSKTLTESLSATDTLVRVAVRLLAETATFTDSVIRQTVRILTQSISISDVLTAVRGKFVSLLESFVATDILTKASTKNLAENTSITASVNKASNRILPESATVSDAMVKAPGRTVTESTALSDTVVRAETKQVSESMTITATLTFTRLYNKLVTEAITITDSFSKLLGKVLTESFGLTDTVKKYLNGLLAIYTDKYSNRGTPFGDKNSSRGTNYGDKNSTRNTPYSDKYTHLP